MDNLSLEAIKRELKKNKVVKKKSFFIKFVNKIFIIIIITLLTMIFLKANPKLKSSFYKIVYEKNISFASINSWYESKFGSSIPFKDFINKDKTVFNEKLKYNEVSLYKDGCSLTVDNNYLVPVLKTGMVVFIGDKENYPNTVIIEQIDGIEVWYSNLNKLNVKMYDYVESGTYLGEVNQNLLYLVYKKDGKVLDYKEYIK